MSSLLCNPKGSESSVVSTNLPPEGNLNARTESFQVRPLLVEPGNEALGRLAAALEELLPDIIMANELLDLPQEDWGLALTGLLRSRHERNPEVVRLILDQSPDSWKPAMRAIRSLEEVYGLEVHMLSDLEGNSLESVRQRKLKDRPGMLATIAMLPGVALLAVGAAMVGQKVNSPQLKPSPYAGEIYPAVREAATTRAIPMSELGLEVNSGAPQGPVLMSVSRNAGEKEN